MLFEKLIERNLAVEHPEELSTSPARIDGAATNGVAKLSSAWDTISRAASRLICRGGNLILLTQAGVTSSA